MRTKKQFPSNQFPVLSAAELVLPYTLLSTDGVSSDLILLSPYLNLTMVGDKQGLDVEENIKTISRIESLTERIKKSKVHELSSTQMVVRSSDITSTTIRNS